MGVLAPVMMEAWVQETRESLVPKAIHAIDLFSTTRLDNILTIKTSMLLGTLRSDLVVS